MKLWKFLLLLFSVVAVGFVVLVGVNFLVLPSLVHSNQVLAMPDFRGQDLKTAEAAARRLDLSLEVASTRAHPTLPAGSILDQNPAPDAQIRGGRVVKVVLSSGHQSSQLAQIVGLTPQQAEVTLQRENFRSGRLVRMPRVGVTQPVVSYQSPQAGSELQTGRNVDMVIADPAPPAQMYLPDLTGLPLYQARQIITTAGLVLAPVQYDRSGKVAPNHILSQIPARGSRVARGDRLVLVVATR